MTMTEKKKKTKKQKLTDTNQSSAEIWRSSHFLHSKIKDHNEKEHNFKNNEGLLIHAFGTKQVNCILLVKK